jgi:hypothetical protein
MHKARQLARETMRDVRDAMGLNYSLSTVSRLTRNER